MNTFRIYFILLFAAIVEENKGQCSFSLGPDICQTPPINLTLTGPPNYTSYLWNNGSKNQSLTVTTPGTYFCTATQLSANLIQNGDFSSGNTGFFSNYVLGTGGPFGPLSAEGTYVVGNDPSAQHINFPVFGDHTTGTGNMMIVNGDRSSTASIWCQSVPVTSNTAYNFSTWVATCVAANNTQIAQLQFSINGTLLGSVFSPNLTAGQWSQFNTTWNSGNMTSATICIVNKNNVLDGNDFALDDIFFQRICVSSDTVTVISPIPVKSDAGEDQVICTGDTIFLKGIMSGGALAGSWIGGNGIFIPNRNASNPKYVPSAAEISSGKLTLAFTVTNNSTNCPLAASDSMNIRIDKLPEVNAGPDQTICLGNKIQLAGSLGGAATGGSWSGGTGTFNPANTDPKATYTPSAAEIAAGKVTLKLTAVNGNGTSCSDAQDEITIRIDQKHSVNAGSDQMICQGTTITLNGQIGGGATQAVWTGGSGIFSPGNSSLNCTYKPAPAEITAGSVTLIVSSKSNGSCPTATDTIKITISALPTIDAGLHQAICAGRTVSLNGVIGGSATTGIWIGGSGIYNPSANTPVTVYQPSKSEEASGKVVLTFVSDDPPGPCGPVSDTVSIIIHQPPTANAGDPRFICEGNTIKLSGSIGGGAKSATWSGGLGTYNKNNKDLNATYTPTPAEIAAGKVTFSLITDSTGVCPATVSEVTHTIYPNPVIEFTVDTPKACPPHCVDFTDLSTAGSTSIVKWKWEFGNGETGEDKTPKNICYREPGVYMVKLTATSDKNCMSSLLKTKFIETFPTPTARFTADPNPVSVYEPVVHFKDQSFYDVITWKWNFGDGTKISTIQHPTHKYNTSTDQVYNVRLVVVDSNGCTDSVSRLIEVVPEFSFYIPNAFTPSRDDGVNDTFYGKGVGIATYHIWIFDRWGNLVFDTDNIYEGWDGRVNNGSDIALQDVYVWRVQLMDIFGKAHEYSGTVTIAK